MPDMTSLQRYNSLPAGSRRSIEWHALIEASNDWQQAYSLMIFWQGEAPGSVAALRAQDEEERLYNVWSHCLVAFERAENRRAGRGVQ